MCIPADCLACLCVSLYLFKRQCLAIYIHPLSLKTNYNRSGRDEKGGPAAKGKECKVTRTKESHSARLRVPCNKKAHQLERLRQESSFLLSLLRALRGRKRVSANCRICTSVRISLTAGKSARILSTDYQNLKAKVQL